MSRAYCLTCNEQVHETPSGTCPLGHPVAADGHGPEPWVGFASGVEPDVAEVPMDHVDAAGRPREHAAVGQHVNGTPQVNGSANGHADSLASSSVAFPSLDGISSDLASDDLTALLAEALREHSPRADAPTPVDQAPTPEDDPAPAPAEPAPTDDDDWNDLAGLAAELHLDDDVATDDGPVAQAAPAPEPLPHSSSDDPGEDDLSASNIDALLAELTDGTPDPVPATADVPVEAPHAPEPPAAAPRPDDTDDTAGRDAPPPPDGVGSSPAADPVDAWAEPAPAPVEESTPAPTVDLYNFTARGKRVGDVGSALPTRKKKRGRKR